MSFVLLLLVLVVIGGIAVVAAGGGDSLAPADPDRGPRGRLPDGDINRAAVDGLRFTLAFRGYRMDEVDDVLDRLATELERREARIAELERAIPPSTDSTGPVASGERAAAERPDHG